MAIVPAWCSHLQIILCRLGRLQCFCLYFQIHSTFHGGVEKKNEIYYQDNNEDIPGLNQSIDSLGATLP